MEKTPFQITILEENAVNLQIPSIDVDKYPIFKNDDESDATFFHRIEMYVNELVKRHDTGEPYAIGYRMCKDGKIRLVIRKVVDGVMYQKAMGFDEDFKQVG